MEEAFKVYSVDKGYVSELVKATEIKSHAHARKLAPFVDESHQMMYWVNWGAPKKNGKPKVAYFSRYPRKGGRNLKQQIGSDIDERYKASKESSKHKKAKDFIQILLISLLENKDHLPWAFFDPEISEFPMSGDFLAGAVSIETEYLIKTPFGKDYRLDIAILGKTIFKHPVVVAGIEVEFTHKFDFVKALICKSLGFPLVSLDITDLDESLIGEAWAKGALTETTRNSVDGFRRNYIYIHRLLSTLYIDIPRDLVPESRHQYVIFTPDLKKMIGYLLRLKGLLKLTDKQVIISPVSMKNEQLRIQVENAGNLAGEKWRDHNDREYIQLTIDKPCNKAGNLYYFHLILAKLCNSELDCLVGYKYELGRKHSIGEPLVWSRVRRVDGELVRYQLAPKRVSEPVLQILRHVEE